MARCLHRSLWRHPRCAWPKFQDHAPTAAMPNSISDFTKLFTMLGILKAQQPHRPNNRCAPSTPPLCSGLRPGAPRTCPAKPSGLAPLDRGIVWAKTANSTGSYDLSFLRHLPTCCDHRPPKTKRNAGHNVHRQMEWVTPGPQWPSAIPGTRWGWLLSSTLKETYPWAGQGQGLAQKGRTCYPGPGGLGSVLPLAAHLTGTSVQHHPS